jgi:hypothetical protein
MSRLLIIFPYIIGLDIPGAFPTIPAYLFYSGCIMTPEHLPTEQYEAQLAEKVVRLQK